MEDNRKIQLLFMCNSYGEHICRLVSKTRENMPDAVIDFITIKRKESIPEKLSNSVNNIFFWEDSGGGCNPFGLFKTIYKRKKQLKKIGKNKRYDCINIHCPSWSISLLRKDLKLIARKIIITPWGSDVYRVKWYALFLLKLLYNKSDYVSGIDNRFLRDVKKIFSVPDNKIVNLNLGSDTVDYIIKNKEIISEAKAKETLNVSDNYVITCGYNGSRAQNHLAIINAVIEIKEQLPRNTILFFPFTYAGTEKYIEELSIEMEKAGLCYKFFNEYLTIENLFLLIQSTDLFVHVQTTDADCGSLKEYILCGKKAINGQWLDYDDLKRNMPLPYFPTSSINSLPQDIINAINSEPIRVSQKTVEDLEKFGWDNCIKDWVSFFKDIK